MSKNIRFTKNNLYAIINQNSRESMINMEIVKYKPEYKNDFIRLSKNWITKYFALESDDFEVFENIDKLIKNGAILLLKTVWFMQRAWHSL